VAEGPDAERVIRELAQSGNDIIFTTSFGYMNPTEKVSKQFPKIKFAHATGYKTGPNFANYNARFYEGRYLTGVIAGKMTKTNVLGYVAAFPIPEVLQGINAFARGARSVNPKAEVRVIWVNSWYDPGKEREAALTLLSQGADVVTHHTDSTAVVQAAEEKGKYAFGYHSDMSKYGPKAHLTATTHQWGDYYTKAVQDVAAGTWKPSAVWGGYKDGMIKLAPLNPAIPADVKDQVAKLEGQLKAGTFHPFAGPVKDQDGKERVAAGKGPVTPEGEHPGEKYRLVVEGPPNWTSFRHSRGKDLFKFTPGHVSNNLAGRKPSPTTGVHDPAVTQDCQAISDVLELFKPVRNVDDGQAA